MSTQKALIVTEVGKPLTLTSTWPIPKLGPAQLLLRVTVTALNPHDQKIRDLGLWVDLPTPLGNDIVGVVDAIGSDVTKFDVGDRVFTYGKFIAPGSKQSGLVQYVTAEESFTAKTPESLSDHEAATLPVNLCASVVGLFEEKGGLGFPAPWSAEAKSFDYASTTLLIIGGGTNCGRFAVQLAKLAGIGKIVVLGGKEEELKRFGATQVLDRHGGDEAVHSRIKSAVGDDLIHVFDTINPAETLYVGINVLSSTRKGKVARLVPNSLPETAKVEKKNEEYEVGDTFGIPHFHPLGVGKGIFDNIGRYLKDGKIVPLRYTVVDGVGLNAARVNEVLDRYRDGKPVVQTHIRISE